jgi:Mg/Co/Ni transporter MgtE
MKLKSQSARRRNVSLVRIKSKARLFTRLKSRARKLLLVQLKPQSLKPSTFNKLSNKLLKLLSKLNKSTLPSITRKISQQRRKRRRRNIRNTTIRSITISTKRR